MPELDALTVVLNAKVDGAIQGFGKVQQGLAKTAVAAQRVDSTLASTSKSSNTATFALTNMGRVLQDLPFGFIGIANNLNPLLESFQRLAKESKDTGTSLTKNLLGSLTGAGGLGLALSAVTAVMSVASVGLSAWTRGFGGAKKAIDENIKSNEDYVKSLENINDAAISSSQKEITNLETLTTVAKNNAISFQARVEAVNKLQETFPAYFGNLSKEQILYGDITEAINKSTDALLNKAFADAAVNKSAEAGTRAFEAYQKYKVELVRVADLQRQVNESSKQQNLLATATPGGTTVYDNLLKNLKSAKEELTTLQNTFAQAQLDQASFLNDAQKYSILSGGISKAGDAFQQVGTIVRSLSDTISDINKKPIYEDVVTCF